MSHIPFYRLFSSWQSQYRLFVSEMIWEMTLTCSTLTSPAVGSSPGGTVTALSHCRTDLWQRKTDGVNTLTTVNDFPTVNATKCTTISLILFYYRWQRRKTSYSVRSNLRSSQRSEGRDEILVPDRVLEWKKTWSVTFKTHRKHIGGKKASESRFTHRLSRLLVPVRIGKSCIMLAPRNILKHTCDEESKQE